MVAVVLGSDRAVESLRQLAKRMGGEVHMNVTKHTTHVVDADAAPGPRVRREVETLRRAEAPGSMEVVTGAWLDACCAEGRRVPLEPKYVRFACAATREEMSSAMDPWGDRFGELASEGSLCEAMALVRRQRHEAQSSALVQHGAPAQPPPAASSALAEECVLSEFGRLDDETSTRLSTRHSMLRGATVYAPPASAALRLRLRLRGARLLDDPDAAATHAALPAHSSAAEQLVLKGLMRGAMLQHEALHAVPSRHKHYVSERWLTECERTGRRCEEQPEEQWFDA